MVMTMTMAMTKTDDEDDDDNGDDDGDGSDDDADNGGGAGASLRQPNKKIEKLVNTKTLGIHFRRHKTKDKHIPTFHILLNHPLPIP